MHQERGTRRPEPGTTAGGNVFRREGEYWTIGYDGALYRLRDTAGLRCLAYLLQRPGEKVAALELARLTRTPAGSGTDSDRAGPQRVQGRPFDRAQDRRSRTDDAELARVKTTRSIKAALQRIGTHNAPLIAHLRATIKTGVFCSYAPDPRLPVEWTF